MYVVTKAFFKSKNEEKAIRAFGYPKGLRLGHPKYIIKILKSIEAVCAKLNTNFKGACCPNPCVKIKGAVVIYINFQLKFRVVCT